MNSIFFLFNNPKRGVAWVWSKIGHIFGDAIYLKVRFRLLMGTKLDLTNPQTFSEKIQWLKLYDRRPEYTAMVDKYAVKEYVSKIIGAEYIIPTLGVWNKPEDIDWESLPNQFVLKTTQGGGSNGVVICKDKALFNCQEAIKKLKRNMSSDWRVGMEWPYKNVQRRIIAEKYMEQTTEHSDGNELTDYKFFCFDGEPKYCQVIRDRQTNETIDFYDMEWIHQEFVGLSHPVKNGINPVKKPNDLVNMINICRLLAKGMNFVRIDLYNINNKTYFGEITFYPNSGLGYFKPDEWNYTLGEMIQLPLDKYQSLSK